MGIVGVRSSDAQCSEIVRSRRWQFITSIYEIETLGSNLPQFSMKEEKGRNVPPTKLYNVISEEIGLSAATLATFYRHQKSPQRTSLDKIRLG
ncbi:hypothetical protein Glove_43g34 [Diversispora epigaea]|uniref:Uncharacterized protein n=1 Tax=Diversispora epigaea TaxID=1348612 RepID=A0A397JLN0_9GLOM|nr:hypothetical protein Glove_43g34 [Diversispora epigaea]